MSRTGKVVCTGRGSHKPRTLSTYMIDATGGFVLTAKTPTKGDSVAVYVIGADGGWGVRKLRFQCPSCPGDFRFRVADFADFLFADMPSVKRDVSALGATLSSIGRRTDR